MDIGSWHGMPETASSVRLFAERRLHLRLKAMPIFCACSTLIATIFRTLREYSSIPAGVRGNVKAAAFILHGVEVHPRVCEERAGMPRIAGVVAD